MYPVFPSLFRPFYYDVFQDSYMDGLGFRLNGESIAFGHHPIRRVGEHVFWLRGSDRVSRDVVGMDF